MSLKNKVAIVTGGSSGIGAAIAIKFTVEGARVTIVGRNQKKLKEISEICEKYGGKPLVIVADITKEYDVKNVINETIGYIRKLDILVNNAGIGLPASILDSKAMDVYEQVMATNLHGHVLLTHLAAKHLVETKGNIVNISSIASTNVMMNSFAYCTSKAALDHFTRSIALELASKGVRVNSVNPGPVKTDILENTGLNADKVDMYWEIFKKITLLNRVSDAEEIADLVAFVVSDKGKSITGSTLVCDNGAAIKGVSDMS